MLGNPEKALTFRVPRPTPNLGTIESYERIGRMARAIVLCCKTKFISFTVLANVFVIWHTTCAWTLVPCFVIRSYESGIIMYN